MKQSIRTIILVNTLALGFTLFAFAAHGAEYQDSKGQSITKLQAIVMLANNKDAVVFKRTRMELSDKGTLKNVKESKVK